MRHILILCLLVSITANAATYYVRTDGNNGNAGTANTSGGAWLTIDYAADNVTAGDTVRVQAGTYAENPTPSDNGSIGNYVTFIADGAVTSDGFEFVDGNTYIRVIGFILDATIVSPTQNGVNNFAGTTSFIEFWHCEVRNGNDSAFRGGVGVRSDKLLLIGNYLHDFGVTGDGGAVAITIAGDDQLVLGNTVANSYPDGVMVFGDRKRYLNNYFYGLNESQGGHTDVFQTGGGGNALGWEQNLVEGTFHVASGNQGDEHFGQFSNGQDATETMGNNIFRRNVRYNTGAGGIGVNQTETDPITYIYVYNDTIAVACRNDAATRYSDTFYGDQTDFIFYKNNLCYEAWGASATANLEVVLITPVSTFEQNYNLAFDPNGSVTFNSSWTDQANEQSNVDPDFVNVGSLDFRLGASSGATGNGGPLTLVNETAGTGTTLTLDDAGYFRGDNAALTQYGGNLVVGDTITVGTDVLTISGISGNDITVTSSFTWADNDPVYFGSDTTPDIGALPFGVTLLSAATIGNTGNDYTVTPTGTARLVVFFQDGIPHTVDNASPYTATITSGTVTARAYALYAQAAPTVTATAEGGGDGGVTSFRVSGALIGSQ